MNIFKVIKFTTY